MEQDGTALLEGDAVPAAARQYALGAGMLGFIAQGRTAEAARLWAKHGPELTREPAPPVLLRLLSAHANADVPR